MTNNVKKCGWLTKEGGAWKSWRKRWFVLENGKISYYKKENEPTPLGVINLEVATHISPSDVKKKHCFQIQTPARTYFLVCETGAERDTWIEVIKQAEQEFHPSPPEQAKVGNEDFELMKVVGKGSFGKVMQVKHISTGKIYAMKMLSKQYIVEHNEVEHTMAERNILQKIHHPFLVNLHYSFQSEEALFLILDFVNGGELFYHLQKAKKFTEERVRFYAAEIVLALEHLHNAGIIYRDLKPENLLLTDEGHIVMTDFGLCKEGLTSPTDSTDTFCGTPEYLAPEVLQGNGYTRSVDWWSFGSLIYEMITGLPPFYSQDVQAMYRKIISQTLTFPDYVSNVVKDLLGLLLERDPSKRLSDPNLIKRHEFFKETDWEAQFSKKITPPFIPSVAGSHDISQIDPTFTTEHPDLAITDETDRPVTEEEKNSFQGFTFVPDSQNPS